MERVQGPSGQERVVCVLGKGKVPPGTPILCADDLGVLRGDGVFETMDVRAGEPWLLAEHLDRMAGSASRLDLPLPSRDDLVGLASQACEGWPAEVEAALRLVCTRGRETGGVATCYATVASIAPETLRARRDGLRVATATLGVAADTRSTAPWLLGGVKSLSYGVNMASQRWSYGQGRDDVLWVSSDGYALEAPTSTLVWLSGSQLCTVPATTGILPGTTARYLLEHAGTLGWRAARAMVRPAELASADAVWLVSSVRGVAPLRELDDMKFADSPHHAALRDLAGFPH